MANRLAKMLIQLIVATVSINQHHNRIRPMIQHRRQLQRSNNDKLQVNLQPVCHQVGVCKLHQTDECFSSITTNEKHHGLIHVLVGQVQCQVNHGHLKIILVHCLKVGKNVFMPMDEYFSSITVSSFHLCGSSD